MENGKEVWRVKVGSREYKNQDWEYCVFAKSAGVAEKAGLVLARKDGVDKPYCKCAEFHCYVH